MDNKDFDKHFSDQLNKDQDFNFQESDWNDLNERMAGQKGKRRRFMLPFWLAFAGSILLGSIFYLWYSNRMTNTELQELRSEILKLREEKSIDTVYEKIIVYKTDTVYRISNSQIPNSKNQELSKTISNHFKPFQTSAKEEEPVTSHQSKVTNHQSPISSLQSPISSLQLIPLYAKMESNLSELDFLPVELKKKPVKKRIKLDLGGQIGISAGWGYANVEDSGTNDLAGAGFAQPSIFKQSSYSVGLHGEFLFNEKLRLTGGVFYERLKLNVENYQSIQNIPNAEAFALLDADTSIVQNLGEYNNADVLQQTLNYEFGLKYSFKNKNSSNWSPYLGAVLLGQSNLKRYIEYAPTNQANLASPTAYSVRAEDNNASALSSKSVSFYGLRATLGTEYALSEHFGLHAEGFYNYNFKNFDDRHLNIFGARAGVYFKF